MTTKTPPRPPARTPSTARTMSMASSSTLLDVANATTPTITVRIGPPSVGAAMRVLHEEMSAPNVVAPRAMVTAPPVSRMQRASEYAPASRVGLYIS